jgi:anti-anti-sigma regulatory factor
VHTVRRIRPSRLLVDLTGVTELDPITAGTLAAACDLGDDHQVVVFVSSPSEEIAADLTAAGVPQQRVLGT